MHAPIGGQRLTARNLEWTAREICHAPSGLFYKKDAGRSVPGIQIELPKTVKPARRHIAQIERRRASSPHAVRAECELMIKINVGILMPLMAGEAGSNQTLRQISRC